VITVASLAGLATVQDRGRPGRMHEGVPPGGAAVPERLARANARAGNAPGEAALEVFGSIAITAAAPVVVASDTDGPRLLAPGETWTVTSGPRRVAYLAVRGGIDVPLVLGSRATLLVAGLGGHEGRALRKGDALPVGPSFDPGTAPPVPASIRDDVDPHAPIRIVPGPDHERFAPGALATLLAGPFEISPRSDRVGVRLRGPALARVGDDTAPSSPMVRGAIQVPPSGEAIVLGPDHPTTGGYPVLAVVVRADLGAVMALPAHSRISFATARR